LLKLFKANVEQWGDDPFLGTRQKDAAGNAGPYTWQTYKEVNEKAVNLARGLMLNEMCPEIRDGDKTFRFCGIWSKNRWEWNTTLLACMHYNVTGIGFYDAMGPESVEFVLNQTEMTNMVVGGEYIKKIVDMRKNGMAAHIKTLISMDAIDSDLVQEAAAVNITVSTFDEIMKQGKENKAPDYIEPTEDDYFMFSYTSGTTGDAKGVMTSHKNAMWAAWGLGARLVSLEKGDAVISYLPSPHLFDAFVFIMAMAVGLRIGFWRGDPLKLVEDC